MSELLVSDITQWYHDCKHWIHSSHLFSHDLCVDIGVVVGLDYMPVSSLDIIHKQIEIDRGRHDSREKGMQSDQHLSR